MMEFLRHVTVLFLHVQSGFIELDTSKVSPLKATEVKMSYIQITGCEFQTQDCREAAQALEQEC